MKKGKIQGTAIGAAHNAPLSVTLTGCATDHKLPLSTQIAASRGPLRCAIRTSSVAIPSISRENFSLSKTLLRTTYYVHITPGKNTTHRYNLVPINICQLMGSLEECVLILDRVIEHESEILWILLGEPRQGGNGVD